MCILLSAVSAGQEPDMKFIEMRDILKVHDDNGYTILEVIMVAMIIGILITIGTAHYLEARRLASEHLCATRLANIDVYEKMYYRQYATYATFQELQDEGFIDAAYTAHDDVLSNATPYIPEYFMTFNISSDTYQVSAQTVHGDFNAVYVRWRMSGGLEDKRGMFVDQTGVVRYLYNRRPVF